QRDEQLGGLLGALLEVGPRQFARGGRAGLSLRELKRITRELERIQIGLGAHQANTDEAENAIPQARGVIDEPWPARLMVVNRAEQLLQATAKLGVQRHVASLRT